MCTVFSCHKGKDNRCKWLTFTNFYWKYTGIYIYIFSIFSFIELIITKKLFLLLLLLLLLYFLFYLIEIIQYCSAIEVLLLLLPLYLWWWQQEEDQYSTMESCSIYSQTNSIKQWERNKKKMERFSVQK